MKRTALLGLAGLVALGVVGCNSTQRLTGHSHGYTAAPRMPTYAIAVTVHGGLQPTPAQWAGIQARVAQELAWHGAMLVTDVALADRIIRVDFRPSEFDPENAGHITILGIKSNPYRSLAYRTQTGPYFPSHSFSGAFRYSSWWGASDYYSGHYYNYMGPWENGFTVAAPVAAVGKPSAPSAPHRPRHDTREICPPDALHPRSGGYHAGFAASETPRAMSTGYASGSAPAYTSPQPSPRWTGERSAWRSEVLAANQPQRAMNTSASRSSSWSSASRSDGSSSRSAWSSSRSDSSWSRPSYTSPSYDSSYSSSSSSGHMSAGSYSAPVYTSPSPSPSYSSNSSSGSMSTSSASSSSSSSESSSNQN